MCGVGGIYLFGHMDGFYCTKRGDIPLEVGLVLDIVVCETAQKRGSLCDRRRVQKGNAVAKLEACDEFHEGRDSEAAGGGFIGAFKYIEGLSASFGTEGNKALALVSIAAIEDGGFQVSDGFAFDDEAAGDRES